LAADAGASPSWIAGRSTTLDPVVSLTEDMKRVVEEQRLAFVATVDADGTPNLSPKGTIAVLDDEHLMFADLASPRTVENLLRHPGIEVNVVDPVARKGFRFKGRGTVYGEGERFEQLIAWYASGPHAVARPRERIRHIVVIELDRCLPLVSPAYDSGASEAEISERWEAYFTRLWSERGGRR
jgi:predicted pyridoxine 5'-phosphate oxidase superfamily flavin-nucleotide-binding protein